MGSLRLMYLCLEVAELLEWVTTSCDLRHPLTVMERCESDKRFCSMVISKSRSAALNEAPRNDEEPSRFTILRASSKILAFMYADKYE